MFKKIFQKEVAKRNILIIQIFDNLTMAENQALAGSEDTEPGGTIGTRNPVHFKSSPYHPRVQLCKLLTLARAPYGDGRL